MKSTISKKLKKEGSSSKGQRREAQNPQQAASGMRPHFTSQ